MTYVNADGDALIHIAATAGDTETVELLLKAGIDPNIKGDMSYTPLHYATDAKHSGIVELLVRYGAIKTKTEFDDM